MVYIVAKFGITTVTGWVLWSKRNVLAKRNSFQAKMNVRIAVVNTPGAASGTITFRKACIVVAPSTLAASSRSRGSSLKNATRSQIVSGRAKTVSVMITDA